MSKEKKIILILISAIIVAIIVAFILPIIYMVIAITSSDKNTKLNVIASNGVEFKEVYTLHTFPDESYEIRLYEKNKECVHLFSGDGSGNKRIEIEFLCSHGEIDYYKVVHEKNQTVYEKLFAYNAKEKMAFDGYEKHIESFSEGIIMFNDTESDMFELFIPAAKHQILNDNNGDYIGTYGERLIIDGNDEILQKISFFAENPDEIKNNICSKEEIILKCNELLQKYGS